MPARIHCLVDTVAAPGYMPEFGLSLFIESDGHRILFDTGAGEALVPNAARMGIDLNSAADIILSHGHYDHTGGLAKLAPPPRTPVYAGRGIVEPCWSLHDDGTKHRLTMPLGSQNILNKCRVREINAFTGIRPGMFLTGPIPCESGEDCGGHFFSDEACTKPNPIPEEQALLLDSGILITGCCHAGIIIRSKPAGKPVRTSPSAPSSADYTCGMRTKPGLNAQRPASPRLASNASS